MEKRKSDRRHVYTGIFLPCILLLLASAGVDSSQPPGPTVKNGQATIATPPNAAVVALKDVPVWEVANERVRSSLLRGQYAHVQKDRFPAGKYPALAATLPAWGQDVAQPAWRGHLALAVARASRPRIAGRMPATQILATAGVLHEPASVSSSPLEPVTVEHRGRQLVLTYGPKPGAASFTGARGSAPRFAIYHGQRQIAAGRFEYG